MTIANFGSKVEILSCLGMREDTLSRARATHYSNEQQSGNGLAWGSAATWRCSTFTRWTEWSRSWWQHY